MFVERFLPLLSLKLLFLFIKNGLTLFLISTSLLNLLSEINFTFSLTRSLWVDFNQMTLYLSTELDKSFLLTILQNQYLKLGAPVFHHGRAELINLGNFTLIGSIASPSLANDTMNKNA